MHPTGCATLDTLLGGGLAVGALTLVYGEAATGKTTLMIQSAVSAAKAGHKVIYIDADRSFSQQRLKQIAGESYPTISQKIFIVMPESFDQQSNLVENLETYVTKAVRLLILDTVTSLYRLAFRGEESVFALNRQLNRQLAYLVSLAATRKIAVAITSQVHAQFRPTFSRTEPVARRTLFHWPKTVLSLALTPKSSVKQVTLERIDGRDVPFKSEFVMMTDAGLVPDRQGSSMTSGPREASRGHE